MKQKFMAIVLSSATTTDAIYYGLAGGTGASVTTTARGVVPTAGKFRNLRVLLNNDPLTASSSYDFHLQVDGVNSTLTVSIAAGASPLSASDTTHEVPVTAGQGVTLKVIGINGGGGAPAAVVGSYMVEFESDTPNEAIMLATTSTTALAADDTYTHPAQVTVPNTTPARVRMVMPFAGTVKALYVVLATAPGAGTTRRFTVCNGTTPSAVTFTIADTATTGNDTAHTMAFAAGDSITVINEYETGAPANTTARYGILYSPTVDGQFALTATSGGTILDNAAPCYLALSGGSWNATETNRAQMCYDDFSIIGAYCLYDGSPGTGNSYDMVMRKDIGACTPDNDMQIADAAVSDSAAETVTFTQWSVYCTEITPVSTPTARRCSISYTAVCGAATTPLTQDLGDNSGILIVQEA